MLAARHNQENVTHQYQTAAAAKPLNQAVSRTPAPKTPYRNRNDENALHTNLKTGDAKGKANLFVTPGPTKGRAVLGAKTTNAKTPGLKTTQKPILAPPSTQKVSPRLKRSKVRIHQAPLPNSDAHSDDSAPEIEYCPPPGLRTPPLPSHPDDGFAPGELDGLFTHERMLASVFSQPLPGAREADARRRQEANDAATANAARLLADLHFSDPYLEALAHPAPSAPPSSRDARAAASALARPTPSFAAPTKATAARVASRATVGYAKGRQVSAGKRAPLSAAHRAGVVRMPKARKEALTDDEERDEAFERLVTEDFVLEL